MAEISLRLARSSSVWQVSGRGRSHDQPPPPVNCRYAAVEFFILPLRCTEPPPANLKGHTMTNEARYKTLIVDTTGLVLYNPASLQQRRDIACLWTFAQTISYRDWDISATAALELLRASYPDNPRLPVIRPAVLQGNEATRNWHKFCMAANREFMKTMVSSRCNTGVTNT